MNLLLHDIKDGILEAAAPTDPNSWKIINTSVNAVPCRGCFDCWLKNKGYCFYKDVFVHSGRDFGTASQCFIISEMTYGGFSAPIKRFFDRSITASLPFFKFNKGEVHHMNRYKTRRSFTFCIYGSATELEKQTLKTYIERVCINGSTELKDVFFAEDAQSAKNVFLQFTRGSTLKEAE